MEAVSFTLNFILSVWSMSLCIYLSPNPPKLQTKLELEKQLVLYYLS